MNNFLTCVFVLLFLNAHSKDHLVVLEWRFKGIEVGYDHLNRCKVSVDGLDLPVSASFRQSDWGTYSLTLSKSIHRIRLVNEAYYEGRWMEHTFDNEFSINAICEFDVHAKQVMKVRIEFDLNGAEVSIIRFGKDGKELDINQPDSRFRGKHYPMKIDWRFIHVEEGYDHPSRMVVFVDNVVYGISDQSVESKGGIFALKIPKGMHRIRIVNQSFVNGTWQDHTIVNNYSVEAVYEKLVTVKKGVKVSLLIDLNNEETVTNWE